MTALMETLTRKAVGKPRNDHQAISLGTSEFRALQSDLSGYLPVEHPRHKDWLFLSGRWYKGKS